jgi:hypothetical protein
MARRRSSDKPHNQRYEPFTESDNSTSLFFKYLIRVGGHLSVYSLFDSMRRFWQTRCPRSALLLHPGCRNGFSRLPSVNSRVPPATSWQRKSFRCCPFSQKQRAFVRSTLNKENVCASETVRSSSNAVLIQCVQVSCITSARAL